MNVGNWEVLVLAPSTLINCRLETSLPAESLYRWTTLTPETQKLSPCEGVITDLKLVSSWSIMKSIFESKKLKGLWD